MICHRFKLFSQFFVILVLPHFFKLPKQFVVHQYPSCLDLFCPPGAVVRPTRRSPTSGSLASFTPPYHCYAMVIGQGRYSIVKVQFSISLFIITRMSIPLKGNLINFLVFESMISRNLTQISSSSHQ